MFSFFFINIFKRYVAEKIVNKNLCIKFTFKDTGITCENLIFLHAFESFLYKIFNTYIFFPLKVSVV